MTTLQATDRQEIWEPRWLVEVATSSYFEPRLFSTEDLQATTGFYHGRLMTHPVVDRSFSDVFWGMTEVSRTVIQLDNADNVLDAIYTGDPRGKTLTLRRYDRQAGTVAVEFTGVIDDAIWSPGVIELSAVSPDLSVFEQLIPRGTVTAASGIAGNVDSTTAVDLGEGVSVIHGTVTRHKLVYVNDDVVNDVYDYLVGVGNLTVTAVYRDGPDTTLHAAAATEYSIVYGVYGNTTIVRFLHRQINFQNGFHTIYADVTGLSAERNFVRGIRTMLSDTVYGLGQTINAASFDAAEALLDPVTGTAVTGLYLDGIFNPRPARDCLRDLLMIRGMRLDVNALGEWTITVDTEQTVEKLLIQDGTGVGERTLLGIRNRRRPAISEKTRNLILRFRLDPLDENLRLEVRRTVNTTGTDRIIEHPYIRDTTTADKTVYYLATREKFGLETVDVDVGQEGRALSAGDLVRLTYAPLGYSAVTMEIRRMRKQIDRVSLVLGAWTPDFYGYSAGALPTDPARPTPENDLVPMKLTHDVEVFTGLGSTSRFSTALVVDTSDNEIDWVVTDSGVGDVMFGETNYAGVVITALSTKFAGLGPSSVCACRRSSNGDIYVGFGGSGNIQWARLSRDGFVAAGTATLFTASGGDTYLGVSNCFDTANSKLFWAFVREPSTWPTDPRQLLVKRTDLAGAEEASVTLRTTTGNLAITPIALGVDSGGKVHVVWVEQSGGVGPFPENLRYGRLTNGLVLEAGSIQQPFPMPAGILYVEPFTLWIDADDLIHVVARGKIGGTTGGFALLYGRLDTQGRRLVLLSPFAASTGISVARGEGHLVDRILFVPQLTSTTVRQNRFDPVPEAGALTGLLGAISL